MSLERINLNHHETSQAESFGHQIKIGIEHGRKTLDSITAKVESLGGWDSVATALGNLSPEKQQALGEILLTVSNAKDILAVNVMKILPYYNSIFAVLEEAA